MTLSLVLGGQGDADLILLRLFSEAVQAAVANQLAGRALDDGHLEPGARDAYVPLLLVVEQAGGVCGSEGLPGLVARYLLQGAIVGQGLSIPALEASEEQSARG